MLTHDEVRPRLAAYAAGDLDAVAAQEVRAHLASGCESCLQEVFGRPVGLPRAVSEPPASLAPSTAAAPVGPAAAPRGRGLLVALVLLAAALTAAVGWMVVELRARDTAHHAEAARTARELAEKERARAALQTRVAALDRDVAELRDSLGGTAQAPPPDDPGLHEELDSARERIATLTQALHRRERQIQGFAASGSAEAVREAVEAPDVELLHLGPVAPFRDVRGHALWHPGAERILVYAYGLPPLSDGGRYRVDVELADGRRLNGPPFPVGANGQATVPVRVEPSGESPRALRVVLEPGGRPVLDWRRVN